MVTKRFDVFLINLDPTIGSEIKKVRPCVIVSPDEMNQFLNTVIIAPLTSTNKSYPSRVNCAFDGKSGQVALDQLRTVDKQRLVKKVGQMDTKTSKQICDILVELFVWN